MPDDYISTTQTTGTVAVGGSATGEIDYPYDRDWFAVTLDAGRSYVIDLEGSRTGGGTLGDPYLRGVHDADGNLIAGTTDNNGGTGLNSRVYFTAADAGTYYVAAGARSYWAGTYTLSVREVADDLADGTGTSGAVAVGGSATGEIDYAYDRDWFAVTLEAGRTYRIDLEGSPTGAGTLTNPYLRGVHDANGALLAGTTNDNGGEGYNSRVTFTADDAGTYYVAAGAWGSREGTYTLSVTEVVDDFEAGTGTSGAVEVGGSATADIETGGDRDWFKVTLEAGRTYQIDLKGSRTGDGTLTDPYLRGVHDEAGVRLAGTTNHNGGAGRNSRVTFTAQEGGAYYVAAGASGSREGTYTLSVTDVTDDLPDDVPDDYLATTQTTGTVAVGRSARGEIETGGDRDWFRVDLDAGRTYRIDVEGSWTGAGTLYNPYLRGIHDADGNLIAGTTNDNGGAYYNSQVFFTAQEGGYHYVAAGAYGNWEGSYRLSVADVTDEFSAGIGTSGAVSVGGSATGDIDFEYDRDWFAVDLDAGRTYWIVLEGSRAGAGTLGSPYLRGIHDADGVLIAGTTDDAGGVVPNSQVFFIPEENDTYYVAAGAHGGGQGTYRLSVTDVTDSVPDDFEAGIGTTGTVAVGGSATGEIDISGDHDWFAVTLEADKTYRIDLEGSWTDDTLTLYNPHLRGVHDANGVLLARTRNNNGGESTNSRVFFTAEEDGTYYVAAGAHGNWEGTYRLSVVDFTYSVGEDLSAGTGTSGTVEVGGLARGKIDISGDRDWFAVTLDAGSTYRIDLEGSRTRAGTLSDPYLRGVHDANGVLLAHTTDDDDGLGRNSRVFFTAEEAGTYYVAAGAYLTREGTYTLSVSVEEVM